VILLKLITAPYVRKHKVRTVLTIAGIVLGVAVFVGMHTANRSVLYAFHQTVDRIAGATQLQITAGEPGFPEGVLEKVQSAPEVRVAVPVIEAVVQPPFAGAGTLLILAVDMTGDRSLRDYSFDDADDAIIEDPLVFLAQADSLIVTASFAEKHGLKTNMKVPFDTIEGRRDFTIRGIMKSGGLTSAFGGNLAIMDVYAAQKVFGRGRRFDRIDLAVNEGARVEDVQRKLEALLGPGYAVESPGARGQQFENLSQVYAMTANITSLFALFIGMFIIFNTFSIAVAQRRSEIGILRALGATGTQIRRLFLVESAVLGATGSAIGIAVGILIARVFAGSISGILSEMYGVAQRAEELSANPVLIGGAFAAGLVTSLAAAWLPARDAARIDPVQALQKGKYQTLTAGENRVRRNAAMAAVGVSVVCLVLGETNRPLFYVGYILAVIAALLLTPALAHWISHLLRPVLSRLRRVEGTLAADSMIQAPRRTSGAVAALMLSLALVISLGGLAKASYTSIRNWIDVALNPDFFVSASEKITRRDFVLPPSMYGALERIEGVEEVQGARSGRILLDGSPVMLTAIDIRKISRRSKLPPIAGRQPEMYDIAARGEGIIISDNLAIMRGYTLGQVLSLPTPSGALKLPVVGIVIDYSDQQGSVLVDLAVYRKWWNDDRYHAFRVYVKKGYDQAVVRQRILDQLGKGQRLFVFTNEELRDYILQLTDQWFAITYIQIAVAVLVAILGIVNTLTVSIADRKRELGVLQAVGGLRSQVRHTIWLEALAIGAVGLALGFLLGAVQLYYSLEIARRDLAGVRLDYEYPVGIALALLPAILGAAFVAALGPAETAVRAPLVEALEYE
jgi:putative ABC transport system permease protein